MSTCADFLAAQRLKDRYSIDLRKHQVQHDDVINIRLRAPRSLRAIGGQINGIAGLAQAGRQRTPQPLGIFYHQDAHVR
jgi:hypothetical protein